MGPSSVTALFALIAVITGCLCAQNERGRSRSGPARSVPPAAERARDIDFDCPEEFGYYPHPADCSLYYVCVFGGALLESCTGGLMYSHELQTCDWPRNVGCDATGAGATAGDDVERLSERERDSPPPPPPRTLARRPPPPPPPRAQPNPVVTSRGQPKFSRDEYEKQQQLYEEVDDLPPVEEIENDRQQRVYRGQPSTIGQVQKDRDGYASQAISSGRTLNSNIIPASIPQNGGKIGSFSFGTQVEERRPVAATQAPQTYSEYVIDSVTDSSIDGLKDFIGNELDSDVKDSPRKKRDVLENTENSTSSISVEISDRNDGEPVEYEDDENASYGDYEDSQDESDRGKRQVRHYLKSGYKTSGKNWANAKPIKLLNSPHYNLNPNIQASRYQSNFNGLDVNVSTRKPFLGDTNGFSTANPFLAYQIENDQKPFKPSLPDTFNLNYAHNPANAATQIITKSPPISSLTKNESPFFALAGFYNNNPQLSSYQNRDEYLNQLISNISQQNVKSTQNKPQDSSILPSTIVTGRPIHLSNSPQYHSKIKNHPEKIRSNNQSQQDRGIKQSVGTRPQANDSIDNQDYSDEEEYDSSEENSSEKDNDDDFKHDFPDPPHEFTHPNNKYADIKNPFEHPNFDFDAFISKLRNDHQSVVSQSTTKPKTYPNLSITGNKPHEVTTALYSNADIRSSTMSYKGMSTPRPFSFPTGLGSTIKIDFRNSTVSPTQYYQREGQKQVDAEKNIQQTASTSLESLRPKLKPPNFRDDRQLPLNYNFKRPQQSSGNQNYEQSSLKGEAQQIYYITATGSPIVLSTPRQHYSVKPDKYLSFQPHLVASGKPYFGSTSKPINPFLLYQPSTPKPLTTIANEQLSALQHYWNNRPTESYYSLQPTMRPNTVSELPKLENLFGFVSYSNQNQNNLNNNIRDSVSSTTKTPPKRRPIPKPSPEMNDYYYDEDEDEHYFYEPPVKPKYMPISEVKPQRPPMAQNYQEYDDDDIDNSPLNTITISPRPPLRHPIKYNTYRPDTITKNYNDVSVVTKSSYKDSNNKIKNDLKNPVQNTLIRPEVTNYEILHHSPRNKTVRIRKPIYSENGPNTIKPPKYLNQTTLRPYTVRHRLAKPTTVQETQNDDMKNNRGRLRHHNIVVQTKATTASDSNNQETRYTKAKHDDKTNSIEPTENVTPSSFSASPRPKMLYNNSQNYASDQYDPYYVYDEDGELYKDTDYVQQYNTASLRPAVQQTYRGTPPPARRPVETYTPKPVSADDYDDALIQGPINHHNQFQAPIRHSTRGEGNELGYDHSPTSGRTTTYEATSIRTTPPPTSTLSTTTQRPTSAPYTEAMTPSRNTPRSSTDENTNQNSKSRFNQNPSDGSSLDATTPSSAINFSTLAKPFEITDNSYRLKQTHSQTTERLPTARLYSRKYDQPSVEVVKSNEQSDKKIVSLTTGFSIRRNANNHNNPYTLTVHTKPLDSFSNRSRKIIVSKNNLHNDDISLKANDFEDKADQSIVQLEKEISFTSDDSTENKRRIDSPEIVDYQKPSVKSYIKRKYPENKPPIVETTPSPTKYYLKTVIKRPAPFSVNNEHIDSSTENNIDTDALIETALQNVKHVTTLSYDASSETINNQEKKSHESLISPYETLNNFRKKYNPNNIRNSDFLSSTVSIETDGKYYDDVLQKSVRTSYPRTSKSKPSYYSYRVLDEDVPDHTTEVFNTKVKSVIKAFFDNFSANKNEGTDIMTSTSTPSSGSNEEVVNIGFQKKMLKYVKEKPLKTLVNRLQIINDEPSYNSVLVSNTVTDESLRDDEFKENVFSTPSTTLSPSSVTPYLTTTTTKMLESSTNGNIRNISYYQSKFQNIITTPTETIDSHKFLQLITDSPTTESVSQKTQYNDENELTRLNIDLTRGPVDQGLYNRVLPDIASTTSTTKSTTSGKTDLTSTSKSVSFPTRASRVNPAIKLAATNPGVGRRSYQSTSKCSSDNSLQANPKCNEIKYQRPTSTRGRGSAHYSTLSASEAPQQNSNRGTPPTRSRPTLKPSTAIVSKTTEFSDIYAHPPTRPAAVYPQPTPDKTAAKCRKDVCLLPDCSCGSKDIPGDLPVESVPQIVLLTFDDSVNDLNKVLYSDLFEKGRVNPNGCPISATFYVSHEWTDYSQVQNLYAAGHEMASHTISHSFGEQFSQKKWNREVGGQREILAAYGGVKLEDVRGMRAPFLSVGGNKMFKMLYDSNFTYDSSMPVYENRPPSWPYTLDYKLFHDCMIPPCPTKSYPGVWEVPMVMWQDLNGGRCSMGDACANPPDAEGVYKMILKNFDRHYTTNRAPFGLFYHAAWFTQPHHKEGFIMFLDFINRMQDVWIVTNWQALQWVRDPTPTARLANFQPFQCNYPDRPKKCNNPKVCNLWHKSGVRYMRTCQPCPEIYPWTGKTGIRSSRIDNEIEE